MAARFYFETDGTPVVVNTVRNIGAKTFFQVGDKLIDSTVTSTEADRAEKIERFSDEYFALVDRYGDKITKYLAIDEPVVIKLDGKIYSW